MDPAGERISIFLETASPNLFVDHAAVLDEALAGPVDLVAVTIFDHCRGFLPLLRERGVPVWIDVHDYDGVNPYHREFVESADALFLSSVAMPGYREFMHRRIEAGTSVVVCTHGAAGATGVCGDEWVDVPALPVAEVVDGNGAGDAFFAGFAAAWTEGRGPATALRWGARMGAAAVASPELAPLEAPPLD
jgi:sugar/nucleoside kinase (ribokinase family)